MPKFYVPDFRSQCGLKLWLKDVYVKLMGMPFYQRRVEGRILFRSLGNIDGKRVLDVGCGDGLFDIEMARRGAKVEAIDSCRSTLERARWRADQLRLARNVNFIHCDATRLPYKDSTFDIAISNCVLEHIPNDQHVLQEVNRVLIESGTLIITVPREFENWDRMRARLVKTLLSSPHWLKRRIGSEPVRKATSFRNYVDLVLIPYEQVRVGYSESEIEDKMDRAGLKIMTIEGYLKMFGVWGIDVLEGLSVFQVEKGGHFGYRARHEWLYGVFFPVLYVVSFLDCLLGDKEPSMGAMVVAKKHSAVVVTG